MEQWKQFRNSNYEVSTDGRIRNERLMILKTYKNEHFKYFWASLKINGKVSNISVHRLVAETYIPNPENKRTVNHKDGNKLNNNVENLEWMTNSENNQHSYDTGLKKYRPLHYKGKFGAEHNRSIKVICKESGLVYGSMSEASRELKIAISSVSWSITYKKPIYGMHFEVAS